MSSFKQIGKGRAHKERAQPRARSHFGLLEKKKDYVKRARDFHRKEKEMKILREKARNRNPDEFFFQMESTTMRNGRHVRLGGKGTQHDQLKALRTHDLGYLQLKVGAEKTKIEKMQSGLHMLEDGPETSRECKHTVFASDDEEVDDFDAAKHFGTAEELVDRPFNRLRTEQLATLEIKGPKSKSALAKLEKSRRRQYEELAQRADRKRKLSVAMEHMEQQKTLMGKGRRRKVREGEGDRAPVYLWKKERKR